ncbi:DUF2213 domain-containing protein [Gracilibacillus oryzae]|uniref:DUF2213 domain-containing protein n=1 Tax=Gracilibacillus oryzae TaxID=1672701 RepID=A0A7C8KUI4_9BACI|nr:DUF2213 domain-containing protein [Gracilibacillus oryzae]KAB8139274.1 DUF2213 domain-containing protein [Gracilibacillus oryzae]
MKIQRYDKAMVLDSYRDDAGYLTVTASITKPGVYPYQRADGSVQYELKHPDDIFSDRVIKGIRAKPITDGHPSEKVNVGNMSRYGKGMSHTDSRVEGNAVVVTITVYDQQLIDQIESGDKKEISLGFETELIADEGTYNGQAYTYRQTDINPNHIAVVERGRVGPEASIRNDSDAWQIDTQKNEGGQKKMPTIKLDGKEFEVDSAIKQRMDALETKAQRLDDKEKEIQKLQGKHDALEGQVGTLEKQLEEAQEKEVDQEAIDAAIEEKLELVGDSKQFLGDSFDFKGKTPREIKESVIKSVNPEFKSDEKSDEYIDAFYDATVSRVKADGFTSTGQNNMRFHGDASAANKKAQDDKRKERLNMKNRKKGDQ